MPAELKRRDGCHRDLPPGNYKRIPIDNERAPIGFYCACPLCGFRTLVILASEHKPTEKNGKLVSIEGKVVCHRCGKSIGIEDGHFVC